MPTGLLDADTGFPQFNGEETNGEKIAKIENYLFLLLENLRYSFSNLGTENFNEVSLSSFGEIITRPILARLEDDEGNVASLTATTTELTARMNSVEGNYTQLTQTVSGISATVAGHDGTIASLTTAVGNITLGVSGQGSTARLYLVKGDGERDDISLGLNVTNGEQSSTIQLTAGGVAIGASQTVQFTGDVVFKSDLSTAGSTTINGSNITTGYISASRISAGTFSGSNYVLDYGYYGHSGSIDLKMYGENIGYIQMIDNGGGSATAQRYSCNIITDQLLTMPVALKLSSGGNLSLNSNGSIYIDAVAGGVIQIQTGGNGVIRIGKNTDTVYIRGVPV